MHRSARRYPDGRRPCRADLQADLADAAGSPVPGAAVLLERRLDGAWTTLATVTTDDAGHATTPAALAKDPADNVFRASYAGDGTNPPASSDEVPVGLRRRARRLVLGGPGSVVDGRAVTLAVRWTVGDGEPVAGPVQLLRSLDGRAWRQVATVPTGDDGRGTFRTTPRADSRCGPGPRRCRRSRGRRGRARTSSSPRCRTGPGGG